jgi:hypothetical protein
MNLTLFLTALVACYFGGYKVGVVVSYIQKLGNSA